MGFDMTDVKKLRKLAEGETPTLSYADNAPYWEYILATNPQAIIEILDRLERYEKALKEIMAKEGLCIFGSSDTSDSPDVAFRQGSAYSNSECAGIAREALEGGK